MKKKKLILVAVMQVVALLILHTPARAVLHFTTYSDGLTLGVWNGPMAATTTTAATVVSVVACDAVGGGSCYQAVIQNPFAFSYSDTITLPQVGQIFDGALFDQTFHDTTTTHENWHRAYADALLNSTYGALETWSSTYVSNKADSAAGALALGNGDLAAALTVAANAFTADFNTDDSNPAFGHQNAVAAKQNIMGVMTWRSQNPDWGQAAVNFANAIVVNFTKAPGNCVCVPEPSTAMICALGMMGMAVARRRRSF